jgi:DNA-binding response OmpR family regulator
MQLNVWYIDDEPDLCEVFCEYFSDTDVIVTTFTDPNAALSAAKLVLPDLLFIDYRLPTTTGDKVAQLFAPSVPIYLVTGDITVNTQYRFLRIFPKPYNEKDILAVLRLHKKCA